MNNKTPALFVSHGNPMLALDKEGARDYQAWGQTLGKPKAILIFSAHWEEEELMFGETSDHDTLVYDFYGFPEALYQIHYPAPGAPWLKNQISELLSEKIPQSPRGLDHGVWVPFLHMWPNADIPILQMSLPSSYSEQQLMDLGNRLAPLRKHGVMIIGGGTLTHNLREGLSGKHTTPPHWVVEFDQWVENTLTEEPSKLIHWQHQAPYAKRNHPTNEHFRPLLIAAGAASKEEKPTFPITGYDMHVFSKRSVAFA